MLRRVIWAVLTKSLNKDFRNIYPDFSPYPYYPRHNYFTPEDRRWFSSSWRRKDDKMIKMNYDLVQRFETSILDPRHTSVLSNDLIICRIFVHNFALFFRLYWNFDDFRMFIGTILCNDVILRNINLHIELLPGTKIMWAWASVQLLGSKAGRSLIYVALRKFPSRSNHLRTFYRKQFANIYSTLAQFNKGDLYLGTVQCSYSEASWLRGAGGQLSPPLASEIRKFSEIRYLFRFWHKLRVFCSTRSNFIHTS